MEAPATRHLPLTVQGKGLPCRAELGFSQLLKPTAFKGLGPLDLALQAMAGLRALWTQGGGCGFEVLGLGWCRV